MLEVTRGLDGCENFQNLYFSQSYPVQYWCQWILDNLTLVPQSGGLFGSHKLKVEVLFGE